MIADTLAELVAALQAGGVRVAARPGDITPPVVYLEIGTATEAGSLPLAGAMQVTFYAYYIPIRGVDDTGADAAALDLVLPVLRPFALATMTTTKTSVTVNNVTWPCYRTDLPALAVDPVEV